MTLPPAPDHDITVFAETDFRNRHTRFGIKRKDRRSHFYLVGKTGMGKSTLMEHMIRSDLLAGEGLAVFDPHGDLLQRALALVPDSRKADLIYFNPADTDHPLGLNVLENRRGHSPHLIASGVLNVFKKIWADSWGPRLEHIFRHTLLALLELPTATLLDVPRLFSDKEYRAAVIALLSDSPSRDFWLQEYAAYPANFRAEAIAPIQNKVGQFLSNKLIRAIIAQPHSAFDLRAVMDESKVLLLDLAKGKVGEDASNLLGALLLTQIELAALSRADLDEDRRRDFYVYIDEFYNFTTASFASLLAEARKYRLNLTLAHQYVEQLDDKLRAATLGNVGTLITFRLGADDAEYLAKEFYPVFTQQDLVNLPQYHICLKLMIDGVTRPAFSAVTLPPVD